MRMRGVVVATMLLAAIPLCGATLAADPRGGQRLDALPPGALAGQVKVAPEAGDPRVAYFVVLNGKDPDFAAMGAKLEAAWKNRRLVRVPPQAVDGLARNPAVVYLQKIEEPRGRGPSNAVAEPETGTVAEPVAAPEVGTLTWRSGAYAYDGSGNIASIGPDHYGLTQRYAYDGVGRLTKGTAHTASATYDEAYRYDAYGNQTEREIVTTTATETRTETRDLMAAAATNRLVRGSYDEAGNLIEYEGDWYFWDGGGMLKEMWCGGGGQRGYVYTPDDERLGVVEAGDAGYWTWTLRGLDGKVIREFESAANVPGYTAPPWFWVEDYAHGVGRLLVTARDGAAGGRRHYHADHLGSTRFVTSDDGSPTSTDGDGYRISEHVYAPFGVETTELRQEHGNGYDRETRLKYTGHERDYLAGEWIENTNYLDYMHARYYNPNLGRFLSVDPAWDGVDLTKPQTWNRYTYVRDNPMNYTDPTGKVALADDIVIGLAIGSVILTEAYLQAPNAISPDSTNGQVIADSLSDGLADLRAGLITLAEHVKGKRGSTEEKHEKGKSRQSKDRGGEKGDDRRRPPRIRPPGHKGPWPPPKSGAEVPGSSSNDGINEPSRQLAPAGEKKEEQPTAKKLADICTPNQLGC